MKIQNKKSIVYSNYQLLLLKMRRRSEKKNINKSGNIKLNIKEKKKKNSKKC